MQDVQSMQSFEADDGLYEHTPDLAFLEELLFLLAVDNLLVQIAVICELHDDAAYFKNYHRFLPSRKTSL